MSQAASRAAMAAVRRPARVVLKRWIRHDELVRVRQQIRYLTYAELLRRSGPSLDLSNYELGVFSQNGEDGVLQEIFSRIAPTSRFFLEIGASHNEANSIFLADVQGWSGVFFDADDQESSDLQQKYQASSRVTVRSCFITPENIVSEAVAAGVPEELDLLSIDVDGNDYWLWKASAPLRARVVVIEYNAGLESERALVQHALNRPWDGSINFGSNLKAMVELGRDLGYTLVHAETSGINLFFVRSDLVGEGRFLPPSEVVKRVPNFYLYGLRHPGAVDTAIFREG